MTPTQCAGKHIKYTYTQ